MVADESTHSTLAEYPPPDVDGYFGAREVMDHVLAAYEVLPLLAEYSPSSTPSN